MIRDLLSVLGGLVVLGGCLLAAAITWAAAQESSTRNAHRREARFAPCPHTDETVDARTAYLTWRCCTCGRERSLGIAYCIGTNRRTRRAA